MSGDCNELPQSLQMSSKIQRAVGESRKPAVLVIGRNMQLCVTSSSRISNTVAGHNQSTDKRASKIRINYGRRQHITRSIFLPQGVVTLHCDSYNHHLSLPDAILTDGSQRWAQRYALYVREAKYQLQTSYILPMKSTSMQTSGSQPVGHDVQQQKNKMKYEN